MFGSRKQIVTIPGRQPPAGFEKIWLAITTEDKQITESETSNYYRFRSSLYEDMTVKLENAGDMRRENEAVAYFIDNKTKFSLCFCTELIRIAKSNPHNSIVTHGKHFLDQYAPTGNLGDLFCRNIFCGNSKRLHIAINELNSLVDSACFTKKPGTGL